eukprot:4711354-Alexandrium_andersonii.AAC.1
MIECIGCSTPRPWPEGMLESGLLEKGPDASTQLLHTGLSNPIGVVPPWDAVIARNNQIMFGLPEFTGAVAVQL